MHMEVRDAVLAHSLMLSVEDTFHLVCVTDLCRFEW